MPNTPDPQAAKAEALLLRFAAEAHRRKWSYDRGLDDDGVPVKSEAFDALHRLGEEMRTALEELRRAPAVLPSVVVPADRATLRHRIAEAMREHYLCTNREEADADGNLPCRCGDWREPGAEVDDENDWDAHLAAVALTALPAPTDRAAVLNAAAQHLYTALFPAVYDDMGQKAAEGVQRAVSELRRLAAEEQPAETQDVDLTDGPVRCPLCPNTVTLHTPNGARAHFTVVHPEQRITGRGPGPWPHPVTDGDEAQPVAEQPDTQTREGVRCVCGDPIEWWTGPNDSAGWIHSPGSDTPILDVHRPRPPDEPAP